MDLFCHKCFYKLRLGLPMLHPEQLATIVSSQPHVAYSALIHNLNGKWTFISRRVPSVNIYFCQWRMLYETDSCLPSQAGWVSLICMERELFALPTRLGGHSIPNPTKTCTASLQFNSSQRVTALLIALILQQDRSYPPGVAVDQNLRGKIKAQW